MKLNSKAKIRKNFQKIYGEKLSGKAITILNHGAGEYSIQQGEEVISVSPKVLFG